MTLPYKQHVDDHTVEFVRDEMHRFFEETGTPLVEVSEQDLVSVTMDMRLRVHSVSLHGSHLEQAEVARLEQALVSAINQAMAEVARRSSERLKKALDQATASSDPEDSTFN